MSVCVGTKILIENACAMTNGMFTYFCMQSAVKFLLLFTKQGVELLRI